MYIKKINYLTIKEVRMVQSHILKNLWKEKQCRFIRISLNLNDCNFKFNVYD